MVNISGPASRCAGGTVGDAGSARPGYPPSFTGPPEGVRSAQYGPGRAIPVAVGAIGPVLTSRKTAVPVGPISAERSPNLVSMSRDQDTVSTRARLGSGYDPGRFLRRRASAVRLAAGQPGRPGRLARRPPSTGRGQGPRHRTPPCGGGLPTSDRLRSGRRDVREPDDRSSARNPLIHQAAPGEPGSDAPPDQRGPDDGTGVRRPKCDPAARRHPRLASRRSATQRSTQP
jgi:hypothetical protein